VFAARAGACPPDRLTYSSEVRAPDPPAEFTGRLVLAAPRCEDLLPDARPTIETIVRQINKGLVPQFETELRAYLIVQDREWLIEQIVRLTLDAHSLHEMDRRNLQEIKAAKRRERVVRVRDLRLGRGTLTGFLEQYAAFDRERLMARWVPARVGSAKYRRCWPMTPGRRRAAGSCMRERHLRPAVRRPGDEYTPGADAARAAHPDRSARQSRGARLHESHDGTERVRHLAGSGERLE
jgi:hypothetical protein